MIVGVTGAAGQVGSVLVRRLLDIADVKTVAVCRNSISAGVVQSLAPDCEIRMGSITEMESAKRILGDCDVIVNSALAMVSGRPRESRLLNKAIIDCCLEMPGLKSLIHFSSVSVYGACVDSKNSRRGTFSQPRPDNDYGRSKLYIERYAEQRCRQKKLNLCVLRLGHVIGAGMDRSRQLIEAAADPAFELPFNGELPSNTVHVERLATALIDCILGGIPEGAFNMADRNRTWREVMDWHCRWTGLEMVRGMVRERSEDLVEDYRRRSVLRDVLGWTRSLPLMSLATNPTIMDFGFRVLTMAPESVTRSVASAYKRRSAKGDMVPPSVGGAGTVAPYYLSARMPGRYLDGVGEIDDLPPSDDEVGLELKKWFQKYSQATWLPDVVSELLGGKRPS